MKYNHSKDKPKGINPYRDIPDGALHFMLASSLKGQETFREKLLAEAHRRHIIN